MKTPIKTQPSTNILDMEQAITLLQTTRPTFYRWLRAGRIKGMKVGRQWRFYREDIERFLQGETPRIDLPASITPLVRELTKQLQAAGVKSLPAAEDNVITAVNRLLRLAQECGASAIHVLPEQSSGQVQGTVSVRLRIDGRLQTIAELDRRLLPPIIEHWKTLVGCNPRYSEQPQDGRVLLKNDGLALDLRVCFVPTVLGESLTACITSRYASPATLEQFDYSASDRDRLLRVLSSAWGVVLCTGPTGSGKTTTLYACLHQVTRPEVKVMSIEDPVMFVLPGVVQVAVNAKAGLTFPAALNSVLRSDPDVVLVGEIRDQETAEASYQAALTGHLVLSQLHTSDAAEALVRLVNIGTSELLVADATRLVVGQRLLRRSCSHCSTPTKPSLKTLECARQLAETGGLKWDTLPTSYCATHGCPKCSQTGFRGRMVVSEMLEVSPEVGRALRRGAQADELRAIAIREGMTTIGADAVRRAALGQTSLEEALRVADNG